LQNEILDQLSDEYIDSHGASMTEDFLNHGSPNNDTLGASLLMLDTSEQYLPKDDEDHSFCFSLESIQFTVHILRK